MNPEWAELPAIIEIIKDKLLKVLRDRKKDIILENNQISFDKNDGSFNIINNEEFELGDGEIIKYSEKKDTIIYRKIRGQSNLEKRIIDPKTGIVIKHIKMFGKNVLNEDENEYYSLVEYTRDPKKPRIIYRTVYKNSNMKDRDIREITTTEYDYGYPVDLEKNRATHKKTPLYFIERYSRYEEWFNSRFKSQDEYIQKVFAMQKRNIRKLWKEQRKSLENRIISFAKTKDKLDKYYSGLQRLFSANIMGPLYRSFIMYRIESIIQNDEFGMFYIAGTQEEMLQEIMSGLERDINERKFEDLVKKEGEDVISRIGSNPDYQAAKETFTSEIRSVEDDDYSLEDALVDIHNQSNIVEDFYQKENPFLQEIKRLDEKITFMEKQMRILRIAYQTFPRSKRKLQMAVDEIEGMNVKKDLLPKDPILKDEI